MKLQPLFAALGLSSVRHPPSPSRRRACRPRRSRRKKELLFQDDFESATAGQGVAQGGADVRVREGGVKGTQTRDKEVPAADGERPSPPTPPCLGFDVPTRDSVVEVKDQVRGGDDGRRRVRPTEVHRLSLWHLFRAQVRPAA